MESFDHGERVFFKVGCAAYKAGVVHGGDESGFKIKAAGGHLMKGIRREDIARRLPHSWSDMLFLTDSSVWKRVEKEYRINDEPRVDGRIRWWDETTIMQLLNSGTSVYTFRLQHDDYKTRAGKFVPAFVTVVNLVIIDFDGNDRVLVAYPALSGHPWLDLRTIFRTDEDAKQFFHQHPALALEWSRKEGRERARSILQEKKQRPLKAQDVHEESLHLTQLMESENQKEANFIMPTLQLVGSPRRPFYPDPSPPLLDLVDIPLHSPCQGRVQSSEVEALGSKSRGNTKRRKGRLQVNQDGKGFLQRDLHTRSNILNRLEEEIKMKAAVDMLATEWATQRVLNGQTSVEDFQIESAHIAQEFKKLLADRAPLLFANTDLAYQFNDQLAGRTERQTCNICELYGLMIKLPVEKDVLEDSSSDEGEQQRGVMTPNAFKTHMFERHVLRDPPHSCPLEKCTAPAFYARRDLVKHVASHLPEEMHTQDSFAKTTKGVKTAADMEAEMTIDNFCGKSEQMRKIVGTMMHNYQQGVTAKKFTSFEEKEKTEFWNIMTPQTLDAVREDLIRKKKRKAKPLSSDSESDSRSELQGSQEKPIAKPNSKKPDEPIPAKGTHMTCITCCKDYDLPYPLKVLRKTWQCMQCKICSNCFGKVMERPEFSNVDTRVQILLCVSCDEGCHKCCSGSAIEYNWKCDDCVN